MAAPRHAICSCVNGSARAGGDFDLQADQIEPRDELRNRVLHLQAGVHLQKVEAPVGIHQEFHRARIVVAGRAGGAYGGLPHFVAHLGVHGHQGRRALLDHLLMPPLDRALAFAEVDHIAVAVAE